MKRVGVALLALFFAFPGVASAQNSSLQETIDARVAGVAGEGIIVGVIDHGHVSVLQSGSSGTGRPLDEHTLFEIGSVTKTFTATLLQRFVDGGKVELADPVSRYLPSNVRVPTYDGRSITLLDLATQHSGLPRVPTDLDADSLDPYAGYSVDRLYAFLSTYHLTRRPGESFEYSNLGVGLLGLALANRNHSTYESAIRSAVWEPLHMSESRVAMGADDLSRFAVGHAYDTGAAVHSWEFTDAMAGAGAIRSDMHDMVLYLDAAMGNGPLGPAMTAAEAPRLPLAPGIQIGLVWWTDIDHGFIEHAGDTAGYHAMIAFTKDRSRGIVILSNGPPVSDIAEHFLVPSIPLTPPIKTVALDGTTLDSYVGTYRSIVAPKLEFLITRNGGQLSAQLTGQSAAAIFPSQRDHFFYQQVQAYLRFVRSPSDSVDGLVLLQNGQTLAFAKLDAAGHPMTNDVHATDPAFTPLASDLASYAGNYHDGGIHAVVTNDDGRLFIQLSGQRKYEVFPSAKDAFYLKIVDAHVRFTRDAAGSVNGFAIDQDGRTFTYSRI